MRWAVALAATLAMVAPARAMQLLYSFDPGQNNAGAFSFQLDDQLVPQQVEPGRRFVAAISDGTGLYAGKRGTYFYNAAVDGGLSTVTGVQLYVGTEAAPLFRTGRFTLDNLLANNSPGTLTITGAPTGAVPEPDGWALLLAGFGLTGAMLRRHRAAMGRADPWRRGWDSNPR